MSTDRRPRRRAPRGLSLIEILISLLVLAIAVAGLVAGVVTSLQTNSIARRRTQMTELAQARLERLMRYRPLANVIGSQIVSLNPVLQSLNVPLSTAGSVDLGQPAGGTGWTFDKLETIAAAASDAIAWPIHVDRTAATFSDNATARGTALNSSITSCGAAQVVNDPAVLCREIHIEDITATAGVPMIRAWVRVLRGGAGASQALVLSQDIKP